MSSQKPYVKLLPPSFSPWSPKGPISKQIAVLMSGGVDSTVAAHLLREDGWDVLGITMQIPVWCGQRPRVCCGADAAFVCNDLGIPHYFVDVADAFEQLIVEPFRRAYAAGKTPNPCVDCNTLLKFSLVWDFLQDKFGIKYLATGHYARVVKSNGKTRLVRARDKTKDQSYFLYGIAAEKLNRFVLPLGDLTKPQVRSIAKQLSTNVADRQESMELCFANEGDYRITLTQAEADRQGVMTDMQGNKIGAHKGIANYTIGQRRGVGFAAGKPVYVGRIDVDTNTIALGTREEVSHRIISAEEINLLIREQLGLRQQLFGKIRSYGDPSPCRVVDLSQTQVTVRFEKPQFAPCPGQRLVLYDGADNVVAGGTITSFAD